MLFVELVDNFNDDEVGPEWGNAFGGVEEADGRARVPCTTGYAGYQTGAAWTIADSSIYVQLPTPPSGAGSTSATCNIMVNSPVAGTRCGFIVNTAAMTMRMAAETGYWDPTGTEITYDPVAHLWLRVREAAGTLYWETAPDGTTWTVRRTVASPGWIATSVDTCGYDLSAHRDDGTDDWVEFDNVNTLSDGAVHLGAAELGAASGLTAASIRGAHANAELAAVSGLLSTTNVATHADAHLHAQSSLHGATVGAPDAADPHARVGQPQLRWRAGEPDSQWPGKLKPAHSRWRVGEPWL